MSSQLDFITQKSMWDIMDDMLNATTNVLDKREGSVIYDAILSMAIELSDFYNVRIPAMYQAFQILRASGNDLDAWAEDFGLTREGAEYTYYNITIAPNDIELVIGQQLTSHDTEQDWLYDGEGRVRSLYTGNYAEARGALLEPTQSYEGLESVTIGGLASEGRSEETDNQLRQRIIMELSTRVGGSVVDYAYIILNQYKDAQNARTPATLVFSLGRDNGHVRVFPANSAFSDIGEEHDLATMERWCTQEQCDALKAYLDPQDAEGHGYGLAPIGHLVHVMRGDYYDVRFKVNVVLKSSEGMTVIGQDGLVIVYDVGDEIATAVENATLDYINTLDSRGMFTRENGLPERRGGRYRMVYMSSEHVAALEAIKGNWSNVMGFQISYKRPGDEEWIEASDDYIQVINSYNECRMIRAIEVTVVGEVRSADWSEVNW